MLKMFKSTFIMYLLVSIIGSVGIFFISSQLVIMDGQIITPIISSYLSIPIIVIWIFSVEHICNRIAAKKVDKITSLMVEECKIKDCIINYNNLLNKNRSKDIQTFLLLNLSTGYLHLGDNNSAKQALDTICYFSRRRNGASYKICYYNNLVTYYLQKNDIESASQHIENMRNALNNPKTNKSFKELCFHLYNDKKILLNIEKGIHEGAEDVFNMTFQREKQKLGKVFAKYTLGKIYLHHNEIDKAIEAFAFVQNNGGDSYYTENAKHYLNNINSAI